MLSVNVIGPILGGRFDIFYFCSARGRGRGVQERGGVGVFENPKRGGGGARGAGRVSAGTLGG